MTQLLERALGEAAKLPERTQDALASLLLEEIAIMADLRHGEAAGDAGQGVPHEKLREVLESDARWDTAFANSQDQLERLAADALAEFHAGGTLPLDPERDFADH